MLPGDEAEIAFLAPCERRPVFHDTPSDKDYLPLKQRIVPISAIHDERMTFALDRHGIEIVHRTGPQEYQPAGEGRVTYLRALSLYHYNPAQNWFCFPDLGRNDLLVFTGYDSDPARPQGVAHAAFPDPDCPESVPPRESIDDRLIAFFGWAPRGVRSPLGDDHHALVVGREVGG